MAKTPTIVPGLPPNGAQKDQLVTLDFEMFGQTEGKLHRPNGTFATISVKLQGDDNVYQLYDEKDLKKLVPAIKKGTWVFHNATYDLRQFRRYAKIEPRFIWDTMLLEQSMRGGFYQSYSLASLSRRWLGEAMNKETREHFETRTTMTKQMKEYAALDVVKTEAILLRQLEVYCKEMGIRAYLEADEPMIFPVLDMQGFRVDAEGWEVMVKEFARKGMEIQDELGFNVNSQAQVLEALKKREKLHLPNTEKETLKEYADRPTVAKIIEARMYRKAASTYGMKWLEENVEADGKVYSDYKITGADMTGRMSSSGPNMQNIPQRKLPEYRGRFIASDGSLISVWDVAQQEPCITAYFSKDRRLLQTLRDGQSTHEAVAQAIYDDPTITKHSDKERYSHGKQINLGLSYGLTAFGLSARTGLELDKAEQMIHKYFMRYSGVHSYIQTQRQKAWRDGYVTTVLGRRSYINPYDRKWENNAINSPIQGSAAEFTKIWARKTWEKTIDAGLPPSTVAFVHDETVFDTPKEIIREMKPIIQEAFDETAVHLFKDVPFAVEYEYGTTWAAKSIEAERITLEDEGDDNG